MWKKKVGMAGVLSALVMGLVVSFTATSTTFSKISGNASPNAYQISLNETTNKLSFDEGGNWDNPKGDNSLFVRKTSLGNDINFRFSGGKALTSVDNNFCIARNSDGWIANETAISGISKIEIQAQAEQSFRFDFSYSSPLNTYSYSNGTIPSTVDYHTEVLTGKTTYTIVPDDNCYCYFRFQQISSGNNWIKYINITYSCIPAHEHEWVHYDADNEYHEHTGNIEYERCSVCSALRNMDHSFITDSEKVLTPRIYDLPFDGSAITLDTPVPATGIQKFDFKIKDPSKVFNVKFLYDWDNYVGYHGGIEFSNTTNGDLFAGASVVQMLDGWTRLIIDFSKLNLDYRVQGTVPEIRSIFVNNQVSTTGALCEVNSKAINVCRGHHYEGLVDYTYNLKSAEYTSFEHLVINIDVVWEGKVNPDNNNYLRFMFGDDWSNYYGYYEIKPDTKNGDFAGVTVTQRADGYTRYTLFVDKCVTKNGTPSQMKFIYVHKWSNQTGWIDYSWETHEHNLVKTDEVLPFRENDGNIEYYTCQDPLCNVILDKNGNKITSADTVLPSRLHRYEKEGNSIQHQFATPIMAGELITIDFKPDDPTSATCFALFENTSWDDFRGYYSFYGDGTYNTPHEEGISVAKLLDGFIRITFDMTKLYKWNSVTATEGLSQVKWLYLRGDWSHTGGYVDFNVQGGTVLRGQQFTAEEDVTVNFDHELAINSIITVDLLITSGSDSHIALMIGNWSTNYGYWNITMSGVESGPVQGITRTTLSDAYVRYTFDMSVIVETKGEEYALKLLYLRNKNWAKAAGWIYVTYAENLDSPILEDIY